MATTGYNYVHPNYTVRRESVAVMAAGGNPTAALLNFQKADLWAAHLYVTVAGTSTGANAVVISINGTATSTLATQIIGTSAVGTVFDISPSTVPATLASDSYTYIDSNDATAVGIVCWEWNADPSAVVTAV